MTSVTATFFFTRQTPVRPGLQYIGTRRRHIFLPRSSLPSDLSLASGCIPGTPRAPTLGIPKLECQQTFSNQII